MCPRSDASPSTLSRRTVLATGIALASSPLLPATARQDGTNVVTPTVLTQNVYLGVDLFELQHADSTDELLAVAESFFEDIDRAPFEARMNAIAGAIDQADADVVGLQEVATLETTVGDVDIDLLAMLEAALADRDLSYEIAVVAAANELTLPVPEGEVSSFANRDVLLVHDDLDILTTDAGTYDAVATFEVPDIGSDFALERGYCRADLAIDDVGLTVVSTHLESTSSSIRQDQASEVLEIVPADRPTVLCGDFNSGPGGSTDTYELLTETFTDSYPELRPAADGYTCCHDPSLRNDEPTLDSRIDAILYRGDMEPIETGRTGHEQDDRVAVELDGETVRLWPADHAGVVTTFSIERDGNEVDSTAFEDETTETATDDDEQPTATQQEEVIDEIVQNISGQGLNGEEADDDGPGFGPLAAIAGIAGAGALARRYRSDEE